MTIMVNDVSTDVPGGLTVTELLTHLNVKMPDMVSVQLNGAILNREDFSATPVGDGDTVDFLYFMGGGSEIKVFRRKLRRFCVASFENLKFEIWDTGVACLRG